MAYMLVFVQCIIVLALLSFVGRVAMTSVRKKKPILPIHNQQHRYYQKRFWGFRDNVYRSSKSKHDPVDKVNRLLMQPLPRQNISKTYDDLVR